MTTASSGTAGLHFAPAERHAYPGTASVRSGPVLIHLTLIGTHHPDEKVAKAARRSAYRASGQMNSAR